MLNLLPPGAQKRLRHEYHFRLMVTVGVLLLAVVLVSLVLIFPSYVAVGAKHASLERKKNIADSSPTRTARQDVFTSLKETQALVTRAASLEKSVPPTAVLNPLLMNRTQGITFSAVGYHKVSDTEASISVEGIARTRNDLVAFVSKLRSLPDISNVGLPVSNLADSTNIPFTVNLKADIGKK